MKSLRRFGLIGLFFFLVISIITACPRPTPKPTPTPTPTPTPIGYAGTFYIAGEGGHVAVADVSINPADKEPIKVKDLSRIVIGTAKTHPVHTPDIDISDRTKMYWATLLPDPEGNLHVGISDLKTGDKIKDIAIPPDPRSKELPIYYCAVGQTKLYYMPVSMSVEGYIDVFDKKTLELKQRVFLPYKPGEYLLAHGTHTPDGKRMFVEINLADAGKPNGKIDLLYLDLAALERGEAKVLKKNTIAGAPGGETFAFRQHYTSDGRLLLQSGRDRFFLIDAETLTPIDMEMMVKEGDENHDAIATPDNKYAILTIRRIIGEREGKKIYDGLLQLYDIEKKQMVGEPVSVCQACHQKVLKPLPIALLCGIDINWK